MPRETSITARIIQEARALGCYVEKRHGSLFGVTGEPDLRLYVPVTFQKFPIPVELEVKVPGKKPRPLQGKRAREKRRFGVVVETVTSVKEVAELIRKLRENQ